MKVDSPMFTSVRDEIVSLIDEALNCRETALSEGARSKLGYPFVAGYQTATLKNIKELITNL